MAQYGPANASVASMTRIEFKTGCITVECIAVDALVPHHIDAYMLGNGMGVKQGAFKALQNLTPLRERAGFLCNRVCNRQMEFFAPLMQWIGFSRPYEVSGESFWQIDGG